jgi:hypothetical protein
MTSSRVDEEAWIVAVKWANSSDTHHGPWAYADEAERWAKTTLDQDVACIGWALGVLTPPLTPGRDS